MKPPRRRQREPRVADNRMAVLARQVLVEAERTFRKADALAVQMEPHLQKLYRNSAIYSYTNERAVPPGDVLLAAALAAGISIDEKLGINRPETEVERQLGELRSQVAQLREEVASLRGPGVEETAESPAPKAEAPVESTRAAKRREWARQSTASPPPNQSAPSTPSVSRTQSG